MRYLIPFILILVFVSGCKKTDPEVEARHEQTKKQERLEPQTQRGAPEIEVPSTIDQAIDNYAGAIGEAKKLQCKAILKFIDASLAMYEMDNGKIKDPSKISQSKLSEYLGGKNARCPSGGKIGFTVNKAGNIVPCCDLCWPGGI